MSVNVALLDIKDGEISRYIKSSCNINFIVTDSKDIPSDCGCIIISEDFAGNDLSELVTELKCTGIPVCIASFNTSFAVQEQFALTGADDVFILPVYGALIEKRIGRLCNDPASTDLSFLEEMSVEKRGQGSFKVDEADFKKLYEFVSRIIERLEKEAHLAIFSFSARFNSTVEPEIVNDFTSVVQRCLRKGDISCKSGHKLYVILMGADRRDSEMVAKRLIETFWSVCDDDAYDIDFEIKPINR